MKIKKCIPLLLVSFLLASCSTVQVVSDYDTQVNFGKYQNYAFFKPGIDKVEISDLDKKRILRVIDSELTAKGMTKSKKADLLINIFTKERERVEVYNNNFGWGWGWGWNPWWFGGGGFGTSVNTIPEGTLYIDFIDATTNDLVWQGVGTARLITSGDIEKKEKRIRQIVSEILAEYPPELKQ